MWTPAREATSGFKVAATSEKRVPIEDDYSAETVGSLQDGDIYLINAEDVARNGDILSASKIEDGNSTFSINIDGYML